MTDKEKPHLYDYEMRKVCKELNMPSLTALILRDIVGRFGKKKYCYQSQQTIAAELNLKRETVNRHIRKLVKRGILINREEKIQIKNEWALRRIFRLAAGWQKVKPWPPGKDQTITHTTQNGAKVTIHPDLSVTTTPPPDNLESQGCDLESQGCDLKSQGGVINSHRGCDLKSQGGVINSHTNKQVVNKQLNKSSVIAKNLDSDLPSKNSKERTKQPTMEKDLDDLLNEEEDRKILIDRGLPEKRSEEDFVKLREGNLRSDPDVHGFEGLSYWFDPFKNGKELKEKFGTSFDDASDLWFEEEVSKLIAAIKAEYWAPNTQMSGGMQRMIRRAARGGFLYGEPFNFNPKTPQEIRIDQIKDLQAAKDREAAEEKHQKSREDKERKDKNLKKFIYKYQEYFYGVGLYKGEGEPTYKDMASIREHIAKLGFKTTAELEAYIDKSH